MELYIANEATAEPSDDLRRRLKLEEIDITYRPVWPATGREQGAVLDKLLRENGYERIAGSPLYQIVSPCDKHILILCPCEVARNLFFHLLDLEDGYCPQHFGHFPVNAWSRYAFQNYEQGSTSARCLYLNDRR